MSGNVSPSCGSNRGAASTGGRPESGSCIPVRSSPASGGGVMVSPPQPINALQTTRASSSRAMTDDDPSGLNVQVLHIERVVFDELAPRLHLVAHEDREDLVGLHCVVEAHLQHHARVRIERGLPQLARVHLAEALVALELHALATARFEVIPQSVGVLELSLF